MKIAQIVCAYPPYAGGIGSSADKIYNLLKDRYQLENFTPANSKPWLKKGHGAVLFSLLWKLKKFDTIYLHYPFFGTSEIIWLYKIIHPKTRLIIHYHMDVINKSWTNKILSLPSALIRKSLLKKADTIITASLDYIKNSQIKKFYKKYPEKFQEIPFSVDTNKFKPKEINLPSQNRIIAKAKDLIKRVNELFIKKDKLNLIFIGGLDSAHYFKGVPVLLEALSKLENKKFKLKIIGTGDLQLEYENLATDLKISNHITFLGKLTEEDMIRNLQESDVLVLPSINRNEAFGLVLIEALACGVPVIASNLPGVRSVFTDKEGLLVNPNSSNDLKEKIEYLAQHEKIRQEMAKAARKLALNKYSINKMHQAYENLLNK